MRRDKLLGLSFIIVAQVMILSAIFAWLKWFDFLVSLILTFILGTTSISLMYIGLKLVILDPINEVPFSKLRNYIISLLLSTTYRCLCLSGIDGAGKTTQIKLVNEILRNLGIQTRNLWMRWHAFISYPFIFLSRILGYSGKIYLNNKTYIYHRYYYNIALSTIISLVLLLDYVAYFWFKVFLLKVFSRRFILCDRGPIDFLIDIYEWTRSKLLMSSTVLKLYYKMLAMCPTIILLVDPDIALKRKSEEPLIKSEVEFKYRLYQILGSAFNIPVLDSSSKTKIEVLTEILNKIGLRYIIDLWRYMLRNRVSINELRDIDKKR